MRYWFQYGEDWEFGISCISFGEMVSLWWVSTGYGIVIKISKCGLPLTDYITGTRLIIFDDSKVK